MALLIYKIDLFLKLKLQNTLNWKIGEVLCLCVGSVKYLQITNVKSKCNGNMCYKQHSRKK